MFRRFDDNGAAEAFESCANELEAAVSVWSTTPLTLERAAEESGYSRESLGRLVRDGRIRNAGRTGSPRIQRGDLPRKPGRTCQPQELVSRQQIAAAVANSGKGARDG
jgi:hypothetical protein